jgi:hypothetical protein
MEKNDMNVIPLCREHHTGRFSIHTTPRNFQNTVGSQLELLAKTNAMLLELDLLKLDKITKKEHEKRLSAQACRRAYFKKYYKKNRSWIIESQRVYKERNFERIAEYQKFCHEHHTGSFSIHTTPREFQNSVGSQLVGASLQDGLFQEIL